MKFYFYSRVSTDGQDTLRQTEQFKKYIEQNGIKNYSIIEEYYSGKTMKRPKYNSMINLMNKGDVLVILDLDRLGRNMVEMKKEWARLNDLGINVEVINMPILNTGGNITNERQLISNIVFELMSYLAEQERRKISQRTKEGLQVKKAQGIKLGRPKLIEGDLPEEFDKYMKLLAKKQLKKVQIAKILNCSRPTLDRYIKVWEQNVGK
ncbi:recombinase family protein [Clostridium perfringens]|uniref:recombinase family protein n=1 Tax=Clostridium perfringens TaxID=1502 RepID=UPI0032DB3B9E